MRFSGPVTVVALRLAGTPAVAPGPIQEPDGVLSLLTAEARVGADRGQPKLQVTPIGFTAQWTGTGDWLEWDAAVLAPGKFAVELVTTHQHLERWSHGHTARIEVAGQTLRHRITRDGELDYTQKEYFPRIITRMGLVTVPQSGRLKLRLRLDQILPPPKQGTLWGDNNALVVQVRLVPSNP